MTRDMVKPGLTLREKQVYYMFCQGMSGGMVEGMLGIARNRAYRILDHVKAKGYEVGPGLADRYADAMDSVYEEQEQPDDDEPPHTDLGHCKCGLRLPCNDCLQPLEVVCRRNIGPALSRSGKRGDRKGRSGFADHAFMAAVSKAYNRIVPQWDRPEVNGVAKGKSHGYR